MKLYDVYPLFDINIVKGQGCKVWDDKGQEYLDLYGGHAVISIGHCHPHYVEMLTNQLNNLGFYSNSVINKLQVTNLQAVNATVGGLVIKASDNKYYRLDIDENGELQHTEVAPTSAQIAAGAMGTGAIIETDLTVQDLAAANVKAINALIDKLTASRIDVNELFARQAFINKLNSSPD